MKGFRVVGPGQGSIEEIDVPACEPGQALINVEFAGICGGDPRLFALNTYGATPEKPLVYGHEFVGIVESVHNPLSLPSRVNVGDRVVGHQDRPCNVCSQCISGRPSICSAEYGARERSTGCFAEYLTRDLPYLFKIEDQVSPKVAALVEPLAVAVFDVRQATLEASDRVLIIGGGTIGILLGLVLRLTGINNVVFSEVSDRRIAFIKSLGFVACNPIKDELSDVLDEQYGSAGVDCVFEVAGAQSAYDSAFNHVKMRGKIVLVALPGEKRKIDFQAVFSKQLHLISVNSHQLDDFATATNIVNAGILESELSRLVTSIYPLIEIEKAYQASVNKESDDIKILVDCR